MKYIRHSSSLVSDFLGEFSQREPIAGAAFMALGVWMTTLSIVGQDFQSWFDWKSYLELSFPLAIGHLGFWRCKPKSKYGRFSLVFFLIVLVIFLARLWLFKYHGFDPFGSWQMPDPSFWVVGLNH